MKQLNLIKRFLTFSFMMLVMFVTSTSPLVPAGVTSTGEPQFRLRNFGNQLITETFQPTVNVGDVWRAQFGLRYTFN